MSTSRSSTLPCTDTPTRTSAVRPAYCGRHRSGRPRPQSAGPGCPHRGSGRLILLIGIVVGGKAVAHGVRPRLQVPPSSRPARCSARASRSRPTGPGSSGVTRSSPASKVRPHRFPRGRVKVKLHHRLQRDSIPAAGVRGPQWSPCCPAPAGRNCKRRWHPRWKNKLRPPKVSSTGSTRRHSSRCIRQGVLSPSR